MIAETLSKETLPGSFRDPSGFIFRRDGNLYRQIQRSHKEHYDHLMASGLYKNLTKAGLLIPHEEVDLRGDDSADFYKTIRPEAVPFISYPYEWSFSQLKDATLATLEIQKRALQFGMSLVDSSAYNIQYMRGRPFLSTRFPYGRTLKESPGRPIDSSASTSSPPLR
jgi:hypothetical protein